MVPVEGEQSWRRGPDRADWAAQVEDYAIIRLDADGRVRSWNAGAELVKGYPREEALGLGFEVFYPAEDRAAGLPAQLLARARAEGRVRHQGWRLRRDGSRFWGDVVITAVRDPDGEPDGYVKVTRDLTEQHHLEQARELFLAGVGHDFRSPLTTIEGYAALIAGETQDAAIGDFAARIRANAVRLMTLVDLIVEHSRLRAGGVSVHPVPVLLRPVVEGVVADLQGALAGREVRVDVPAGLVVEADPTALVRVLTNVLGNAAKYSPPEEPVDVLACARDGADGPEVELVVADRGRGIAPEDRERVLREFERGSRAEPDGGFGLGLAVVRHLVELHGGGVVVAEGRYGGTDLVVRLPAGASVSRAGGA